MKAAIQAIEFALPETILDNVQLSREFPEWPAEKIEQKLGIRTRHVVDEGVCASDLAVAAAERLFAADPSVRKRIDYLLLCTQSPDHFLPTTACLLQNRLQLPTSTGALDFNMGCSGYIYGLSLAKGLIETAQARNILLITAETYSKYLHPRDKSVRTLFGDGAAATLVTGIESTVDSIGPFVLGTDGSGASDLIVPAGGMRQRIGSGIEIQDEQGNIRTDANLRMNGPAIFSFSLRVVPQSIVALLERASLSADGIDLFVFHQANRFMLEQLRNKMHIPQERFMIALDAFGNTVSSTIPIALKEAMKNGRLSRGATVVLAGFGVGLSWGACVIRWHA